MRTLVAIAALVGTASADVGGTASQSIQPGGKVAFTKSGDSGRVCWTTGTTGSPANPVCSATTNGAATAVGSLTTVVCSADSTTATVDLTWDVATQLKITAIECSAANADVGNAATYTVTARTLTDTASAAPTIQVNDNLAFTMTLANSHLCYTAKAGTSPTAAVCAGAGSGAGPSAASDTATCTNAGTQVGETLIWGLNTLTKVSVIECANGGSNAIGIAEEITVTARTLANAATPTIQVNDNLAFTMTLANSHLCYTAKAGTSPTTAVCAAAGVGTGPTAASDTATCTNAGTQVGETLIWGDATLTKVSVVECANGGSTAVGIAEEITVTATTRPVVKATFKSISGTGGSEIEMGSVTIDEGGIISVTMDLTNADQTATPTPNSACYSSGLSWHIHESWSDAANAHGVGSTECGGSNTGGHYDPAFGWYVYIPIRRGRDAHPSVHSP